MTTVRVDVAKLNWVTPRDQDAELEPDVLAEAAVFSSKYVIQPEGDHFLLWSALDEYSWTVHPTVDAAQDAAQAEFDRTIRLLVTIHVTETL